MDASPDRSSESVEEADSQDSCSLLLLQSAQSRGSTADVGLNSFCKRSSMCEWHPLCMGTQAKTSSTHLTHRTQTGMPQPCAPPSLPPQLEQPAPLPRPRPHPRPLYHASLLTLPWAVHVHGTELLQAAEASRAAGKVKGFRAAGTRCGVQLSAAARKQVAATAGLCFFPFTWTRLPLRYSCAMGCQLCRVVTEGKVGTCGAAGPGRWQV